MAIELSGGIARPGSLPFRSLKWGWEQVLFASAIQVREAFNKRNQGTRIWHTRTEILVYVLEGRLQFEHWAGDGHGAARLCTGRPVLRVDAGELICIEAETIFRMVGVTDARYLMIGSDKLLSGLTEQKVAEDPHPSPVPHVDVVANAGSKPT